MYRTTRVLRRPEEQRLVIYTSHKREVYEPIIREFEQRTGIWIELETGGTTALLERIAQGGTDCDLMFGGGVDSLSAYADCFSPYLSENGGQVLPAYASPDGFYTPFSALPVVLIYNTRLVRTNPPTGWGSLTDSKWARARSPSPIPRSPVRAIPFSARCFRRSPATTPPS